METRDLEESRHNSTTKNMVVRADAVDGQDGGFRIRVCRHSHCVRRSPGGKGKLERGTSLLHLLPKLSSQSFSDKTAKTGTGCDPPCSPPSRFCNAVMEANMKHRVISAGTAALAKSSAANVRRSKISGSSRHTRNISFVQPPGPGELPEGDVRKHLMTMDSGVRNPPLLGAKDFASPMAVSLSTHSMSPRSSALMEPLSIRDVLWILALSRLDSALPLLCDGGHRPCAACGDHTRVALLPQTNDPTIHLQNHPSVGPTHHLLCPRDEAYATTVSGSNRTTSKPWSPPQRLSPTWLGIFLAMRLRRRPLKNLTSTLERGGGTLRRGQSDRAAPNSRN